MLHSGEAARGAGRGADGARHVPASVRGGRVEAAQGPQAGRGMPRGLWPAHQFAGGLVDLLGLLRSDFFLRPMAVTWSESSP